MLEKLESFQKISSVSLNSELSFLFTCDVIKHYTQFLNKLAILFCIISYPQASQHFIKLGEYFDSCFSRKLSLATQNLQISVIYVLKKCITNDIQNWKQWYPM